MIYTVTFNPAIDYVVRLDRELQVGDVNRARGEDCVLGGKGINVSGVLAQLGCESVALGFVAGETGAWLERGLAAQGLKTDFVHLDHGMTRINVKIKAGQEPELNGAGPAIPESALQQLEAQLDKLARHNRQESYKSRQRYYEAMQRFCRFLAEEYRLQKLTNISGKHLVDYVRHLQENGKAASTIKTELAAIRFWHDKLGEAKYKLPSNADLADQAPLERRKLQGTARHWTPEQFTAFVAVCREVGRTDYADIATLTFYVGLRIHEVCRLDTAAVEAWERSGLLTVKGKGGRVRSVPVTAEAAKQALRDRRAAVQRGHKLFVPDDVATDAYIHAFQAFLREHRPDQGSNPYPLTHHGMRHSYAARQYREALDGEATEYRAKLEVSKLLGHGRADVTDVYLACEKPENQ